MYALARIDLDLTDRPGVVEHPLNLLLKEVGSEPRALPEGTKMKAVFESHGRCLLILGAPGSGKTTLLLELARELLDDAETDDRRLIPVVFNLSSWAAEKLSLAAWMTEELTRIYHVPRSLAEFWVTGGHIIPLLDGLDEVGSNLREECADTINAFRDSHGLVPIAICSRIADFECLKRKLKLSGAISIESLTHKKCLDYLNGAGEVLSDLRLVVANHPKLLDLIDNPLMLSVAMLAYKGAAQTEVSMLTPVSPGVSLIERRRQLFAQYVRAMFRRRSVTSNYDADSFVRSLSWLASALLKQQQSIFHLESLLPNWLDTWPRRCSRFLLFAICGIAGWIAVGDIRALAIGLGAALLVDLPGLVVKTAISVAVPMVRVIFRSAYPKGSTYTCSEAIKRLIVGFVLFSAVVTVLSYAAFVLLAVMLAGIVGALGAKLMGGIPALIAGSIVGLLFVLVMLCHTNGTIVTPTGPDQKTHEWLRHATGAFVALTLIGFMSGNPTIGLLLGVVFGLASGGALWIQHWIVRTFLYLGGDAPLLYGRFLDRCTDLIFLRKVGGGYIFVHRLLMEYFATLGRELPARPLSSTPKSP